MATKEDTHTVTILIVYHDDWTTQQLPIATNADIHILATIPPHAINYDPKPEWPKYYKHIELAQTSIICIHNQVHPTTNLQTPHPLQQVLQNTTNTHIDTYPIKPTPMKYHVKISKAWKDAPKANTLTQINTQITPLPAKYYHIHPLNYHPQQCIYMDGSFIPPTKNAKGQIEGNTIGSGVYNLNNNI